MPIVIHPRLRKSLLRLVAMTAVGVLAPAGIAAAACPTQATTEAFAQFGDTGQYFPAPGGTFEGPSTPWTVAGGPGAGLTPGNETYFVYSPSDTQSLSIPAGGSADSPSFCVDQTMIYFRFFSKQNGGQKPLSVSLVLDSGTDAYGSNLDNVATLSDNYGWTPSGQTPLSSLLNIPAGGAVQAHLHFQAGWGRGNWQIDDVLVDPYRVA